MQPKLVLLLLLLLLPFICPFVNGTPIDGHKNHSNHGGKMVNGTAMTVKRERDRPQNKDLLSLAVSADCTLLRKGNWTMHNLLNVWTPMKGWTGYGCYCGPGHRGGEAPVPVDAIDKCCQMHDECYGEYNAKWRAQCVTKYPWLAYPYLEIYAAQMCNASMGYETKCLVKKNKPCQEFLCECDKTVVECLLKQPGPTEVKGCPGE